MKKIFVLFALLSAMSVAVVAQEANQLDKDSQTSVKPVSEDMLTIQLGCDLARYGYSNKSALSLIEAARLLGSVTTQPATDERSVEGVGQTNEGKKHSTVSYDPKQILKDAKKYAGKDKTLLALADQVEKSMGTPHRGSVVGANTIRDCVEGNTTDIWKCRFRGGEVARVIVVGDGDTDLDLYIYDENNNLIAQDIDYTDNCVCSWTPMWTGTFTIKIKNRGNILNCYSYYHN